VAGLVGAPCAGALEVGAACTGWLSALAMACGQIESGRARHALVVGADFLSRFLDVSDRDTAPLFADGAGAAVVSATDLPTGRVGPIVLRSDPSGSHLIRLNRGDYIRIEGPESFRAAVASMTRVTTEALDALAIAASRTSTCSSTTRPTRGSSARAPAPTVDHPSVMPTV
jgi:3-oxoacyl-[acyl-carrier-protein] synthase-3